MNINNSAQTKMLTIQIRMAMMASNFGLRTTWGNFDSASTTKDMVKMPYFNADDPEQYEAAMGFGLHESAHHRYKSDFKLMNEATQKGNIYQHVLNITDDGRIERRSFLEYPGTKSEFEAIERLFISRNQRVPANDNMNPISVLLCYYAQFIGANLLGYTPLHPLFETTKLVAQKMFPQSLLSRLEIIGQMGAYTRDCSGSWEATLLFVEAIRSELEEAKKLLQTPSSNDSQDDSDADNQNAGNTGDDDSDADDQNAGNAGDDDSNADNQNAGNAGDDDSNADDQNAGNTGDDDSNAGGQNAGGGKTEADTQSANEDQIANLEQVIQAIQNDDDIDSLDKGDVLASIIKPESTRQFITPLRPDLHGIKRGFSPYSQLAAVKSASRPLCHALSQLIEVETNKAPGIGRRGKRFIVSRKTRYLQGDMRVYRTKAETIAVDSSMLISLDLSGSMSHNVTKAKDACLSLALAIEDIEGAQVAVQTFGDKNYDILKWGESVSAASGRFDAVYADGSTPMREALSNAFMALLPEETNRKSLVMITDGEPDCDCTDTFNLLRQHEIDVFGLFIGEYKKGREYMDKYFNPGGWIAVRNINDLRRELFKFAKQTFLSAA